MSTRREFFKLIAAGAAVAFVPFVAEAAPALLPPKQSASIIGRSLWFLRSYEFVIDQKEIARLLLTLCRGSSVIELTLAMQPDWPPPFSPQAQTEIELEVAWENGGMVILADGKKLDGVLSLSGYSEPSYIDATLLGDSGRRWVEGP